ncbi:MAG TPA: metal-sulfur cluster assembly factor, partial [Chloroflexota bacterium]|nr:metal-sulfur cluster assembly factor [Chloroflexota bacterium]
ELPHYATDLAVRGEGVALEIENEHAVATLSPQTGQLERLRYKRAHGLELFAGGEGHGEPPHIDWAHDYLASNKFQKFRVTNWNRVRSYEVVRGPVCTIVRRWGFPHSPLHPVFTAARMLVDVSYVFYAGAPYFLKEGTMRAVQDFELNYLRDDEWVFSGYAFTDLLWMDEAGKAHEGPVPKDQAERMWGVGFFHRQSGDAFFSLRLRHELEGGGGARLYHADAPALDYKGHGQLWSRWALRGDPRLRAGDTLHQRNAYLVEPYGEDGAARLEEWRTRLLNPLRVGTGGSAPAPHGGTHGEPLARPGESGTAAALKTSIWNALREVRDDMFYTADANVADMGYVYDVRVRHGEVEVLMTMPHRGRPKYMYLGNPIKQRLAQLPGVRSVTITPVWEPAWTPHRMSDEGWRAMGLHERGDA